MNATMFYALQELRYVDNGAKSIDLHAIWDRTHGYLCYRSPECRIGFATLLALEERGWIKVWNGFEPGHHVTKHFHWFQISDAGQEALEDAEGKGQR